MTDWDSLEALADRVGRRLLETGERLVLAESCTGGLAAAMLAGVPGISRALCGSAVVYRDATKIAWLAVPPALIQEFTAVSAEATAAIGEAALRTTSEATIAAAITGHLGPGVSVDLDGRIFTEIRRRGGQVRTAAHRLPAEVDGDPEEEGQTRRRRQRAAAAILFESLVADLG